MRLLSIAGLLAAVALASASLTVEQLRSFIRSSVQLKHPDKRVADFLKNVKLIERLDSRTIDDFQHLGAGPKTIEALRGLGEASAKLPPPPPPKLPAQSLPPPPPAEQDQILKEMTEYARDYVRRLPNFICVQVTRRYADPSGMEFWQRVDTVTARLSYNERREDYKVVLVNDSPIDTTYEKLDGATSTGEFGSMLREIFEPEAQARFEWQRWATLRGKRMHVFAYRIAQPNSKWSLVYEKRDMIRPAYSGLIYADRETLAVMRITLDAQDLPAGFAIQQASTTLDYDYTDISGQQHILPLKAVIRMRSGRVLIKNEVEFRLYRRFGAEATITFTPDPIPDDQTKETK